MGDITTTDFISNLEIISEIQYKAQILKELHYTKIHFWNRFADIFLEINDVNSHISFYTKTGWFSRFRSEIASFWIGTLYFVLTFSSYDRGGGGRGGLIPKPCLVGEQGILEALSSEEQGMFVADLLQSSGPPTHIYSVTGNSTFF